MVCVYTVSSNKLKFIKAKHISSVAMFAYPKFFGTYFALFPHYVEGMFPIMKTQ
jgi:hypothetical protein